MIEQMYGKGIFLEDAANALIPEHYSKALAECELEIVSQPEIDVTQAEPGKPFIFTAEVAVKPEVTLASIRDLRSEEQYRGNRRGDGERTEERTGEKLQNRYR